MLEKEKKHGKRKAPMIADWMSYLYQPILPVLKKIHIRREGPRGYNPQDILLPQGYTAELVASEFNAAGPLLLRRPGILLCGGIGA